MSSDGTRVAIGAMERRHRHRRPRAGVRRERRDVDPGGRRHRRRGCGRQSGYSVSMSSDGTRVAIGATERRRHVAGHVRVYARAAGRGPRWAPTSTARLRTTSPGTRYRCPRTARAWRSALERRRQRRRPRAGVRRERRDVDPGGRRHRRRGCGRQSGYSVSMSSDGTRVAIGALERRHRHDAGHVRVYARAAGRGPRWAPTSTARLRATSPGTRYRCPRTARAWRSALHITTAPALTPATCGCTMRRYAPLLQTRTKTARTASFIASTVGQSAAPPGHARARLAMRATKE